MGNPKPYTCAFSDTCDFVDTERGILREGGEAYEAWGDFFVLKRLSSLRDNQVGGPARRYDAFAYGERSPCGGTALLYASVAVRPFGANAVKLMARRTISAMGRF